MRYQFYYLVLLLLALTGLTACNSFNQATAEATVSEPTPTISTSFSGEVSPEPLATTEVFENNQGDSSVLFGSDTTPTDVLADITPVISFDNEPTPTTDSSEAVDSPTAPEQPDTDLNKPQTDSDTSAASRFSTPIVEFPIYGETLHSDWTLEQSRSVSYTVGSRAFLHDGNPVIEVRPQDDFGMLYFTVLGTTRQAYTRDRIVGVSFWISGGENLIENSDLAVTVVGSNAYPYWRPGDNTVDPVGDISADLPLFSETRLYYLGINHSIRPNTWEQVVLWLDERQFDPIYTYVTGIYIKHDAGFKQPYYIDQVNLLVQGG